MRSQAVILVSTGVLRTEILQLCQKRNKPFCAFTARVHGKAETCTFITMCECRKNVDYTDHVIRDVLLNGISDPDICREVLGNKNVLQTPVNDVIALVENKEMTCNVLPSSTLSAVSSFKPQQEPLKEPPLGDPVLSRQAKQVACPDCKNLFCGSAHSLHPKPPPPPPTHQSGHRIRTNVPSCST